MITEASEPYTAEYFTEELINQEKNPLTMVKRTEPMAAPGRTLILYGLRHALK